MNPAGSVKPEGFFHAQRVDLILGQWRDSHTRLLQRFPYPGERAIVAHLPADGEHPVLLGGNEFEAVGVLVHPQIQIVRIRSGGPREAKDVESESAPGRHIGDGDSDVAERGDVSH